MELVGNIYGVDGHMSGMDGHMSGMDGPSKRNTTINLYFLSLL